MTTFKKVLPVTPGTGRLAGGVYVHEGDGVGLVEGAAELVAHDIGEQGDAGIAVRLEQHVHTIEIQALAALMVAAISVG